MPNIYLPVACPECQRVVRNLPGHLRSCLDPYLDVVNFNAKVQVGDDDACWPFMGARVPAGGYGRFRLNQRLIAAHRVAYMLAYGDIPAGLDVMHLCDNPPCCNPRHLKAATTLENMRDAKAKGRHVFGERSWNAKLTEDAVREIRRDFKAENKRKTNAPELAARYGVGIGAIHAIVRGEYWKQVR